MMPRHNRVFFGVAPLIAFSLFTLALLDPDPGSGFVETIGLGYFFGSLFAHTTLAAAWSVLGPARLVWRVPLSLVWVLLLPVAIAVNIAINGGPREAPLLLGACLLGQWLLLQFPLWGLRFAFQLQLQHEDEVQGEFDPREWQFGIRQLLIVTTIAGVVFGIGRVIVANLPAQFSLIRGEGPIFLFLAAAAIVLTLPLLLAGLLKRNTLLGVTLVLGFLLVGNLLEWPLLKYVHSGPGPKLHDLFAINAFSAALILAVVMTVRLSGYRLIRQRPEDAIIA